MFNVFGKTDSVYKYTCWPNYRWSRGICDLVCLKPAKKKSPWVGWVGLANTLKTIRAGYLKKQSKIHFDTLWKNLTYVKLFWLPNPKWTGLNAGVRAPRMHWGHTHSSHVSRWSRAYTRRVYCTCCESKCIPGHVEELPRCMAQRTCASFYQVPEGSFLKPGFRFFFPPCCHIFQVILKPENPYLANREEALMSRSKEAAVGERWKLKITTKPNNRKKKFNINFLIGLKE